MTQATAILPIMAYKTKPPRSAPPPIRRSIGDIIARLAQTTSYVDPSLVAAWSELAGDKIARIARPGRLSGGRQGRTLEVYVSSGAAATEIQFESRGLIDRLNEYFGTGVIGHIHIVQTGSAASKSRTEPRSSPQSGGGGLSRFRNND